MVARVLFLLLPCWGNTTIPRPRSTIKGHKCYSQPLIVHPRPYGSPGLLPDLPTSVDASWATARALKVERYAICIVACTCTARRI